MVNLYCCVRSCWKSRESKHRFPNPAKNEQLFLEWIRLIANRELQKMPPMQVYNNYRVCSLHFVPEDFGPNHKLKPGVVPSMKLGTVSARSAIEFQSDDKTPSTSCQTGTPGVPCTPQGTESARSSIGFQGIDEISSTSCQTGTPGAPGTPKGTESPKPSTSHQTETLDAPCTPKGRHGLLSEVHVSKIKQLTPKAKHLYQRAKQFKRQAFRYKQMKGSLRKRLIHATKFSKSHMFQEVVSSMDRIRARFFESQIENVSKKPRGRRFTVEDKVLALALYKQSGTSYRFLSKLFALPSRKTVMRLLNRIPIQPGLHEQVFTVLKAELKNFKNPLDKYCTLLFDEMSIQPNLTPNIVHGRVEGFEDYGYKRTRKIADHAQVFMLRGISRKWKQPIYYSFVNGATKNVDIVHILKLIIRKCQSIGLRIVATICDQSQNNSSAINSLVKQTHEQYKRCGIDNEDFIFEIDGEKIIPLFDVPHLFKGIRNNLLKYPLCFHEDGKGKLAKWDHIYTAYKMDAYLGDLRLMPRLTDAHVNPQKIHKMKVSKCTQVLSHSVAVGINVFALSGTTMKTEEEVLTLDKEATDTANILEFFDKLFDSLNGSSFQSHTGKNLRVAVTERSIHHKFWDDALQMLRSCFFVHNGKYYTPPSLKNLSRTIKNFKELFKFLSSVGFTYMMPRSFNQDPLENFFGKVRQRGMRNINPTPTAFTPYYKSLLVNGLTSKHSIGGNCEEDDSDIFLSLQRLVTQGLPEEDEDDSSEVFSVIPRNISPTDKPLQLQVLKYVSGYIAKKIGKQPCDCREKFFVREAPEDFQHEQFMKLKEYREKARLKYVNSAFLSKMKVALAIIKYIFNRDFHKKQVVVHTLNVLKDRISFTSCFHDNTIKTQIFKYLIKVTIFNYSSQLNQIMNGQDLRVIPKNAPPIFISAKEMFLKSSKKKK